MKAETAANVASLEDAIADLAHENALLKRRLYGNRTERSQTSEPRFTSDAMCQSWGRKPQP